MVAALTGQPGEAVLWVATRHETPQFVGDEARQAATLFVHGGEQLREALPDDLVEQVAGRVRAIEGGGHPARSSKERASVISGCCASRG